MGDRVIGSCVFCHNPITSAQEMIQCDTFRRLSSGIVLTWRAHYPCSSAHWMSASMTQNPSVRRLGKRFYRLTARRAAAGFRHGYKIAGRR